jgi:hypothetical protein
MQWVSLLRSGARALLASGLVLALCLSSAAWTQTTAELTVVDAAGKRYDIDERRLATLPATVLVTHTAWTEGPQRFEGVLLRDVLAMAGIDAAALEGRSLEATALNDYRIVIPAADFLEYDVLLAWSLNGKPLTRRDKGPYWIVYPRDQHPGLADSRYELRWVWQLRELRVR